MASVSIVRELSGDAVRYRVRYRLGGRDAPRLRGGTFRTLREARTRRDWIAGEIAAMRVPDLTLIVDVDVAPVTLRQVAETWRRSRVDVSDGTDATYAVNLSRFLPRLGHLEPGKLTAGDVTDLVAHLTGEGLAKQSIRKTLSTLAMILDFAKVTPNPARDRDVKLPRERAEEVDPPTASHVLDVHGIIPRVSRLPLLVLDATGMRVGELEQLRWRDVDEPEGRWRVASAVAKTGRARWVPVLAAVFAAVTDLVPREDRDRDGQVFAGFTADAFRTQVARACSAAGVPVFSPHDLRHRRATLWHLSGVPVAEAAAWLGHSAPEHLRTYAHASLDDRSELDHAALVGVARLPVA